jgi:hypothetical protein
MFRKELFLLCSAAALVFILVALAGSFVSHTIQQEASRIAVDNLPGLVDAGEALLRTEENWLRVHLLGIADQSADRTALIQQIHNTSTEPLWRDYQRFVFEPEDQENYNRMLADRKEFIKVREVYLKNVLAEKPAVETEALFKSSVEPAYQRYKASSEKLFAYNSSSGRERAAKVLRLARAAPWVLGGFGMVIFALGVLFGMRTAFGGLDLTYRTLNRGK